MHGENGKTNMRLNQISSDGEARYLKADGERMYQTMQGPYQSIPALDVDGEASCMREVPTT